MLGRVIAYILTVALLGMTFQFVGNDAAKVNSNVALLFLISKVFTLGTCIVTIMNSQNYLEVLMRENINSWYGVCDFYFTRTIIEAGMNCLIASVFSTFIWLLSGQQSPLWPNLLILIVLLCIHCIAFHHMRFGFSFLSCFIFVYFYHLSYIIAMFSNKESLSQLPFAIAMLQVMFGGYFCLFDDLPVWIFWMRYLVFGSFTYTGLMKLAYLDGDGNSIDLECVMKAHPFCQRFKTSEDVLTAWSIDMSQSVWIEVCWLLGWAIFCMIIGLPLTFLYMRQSKRSLARI